MAYMRKFKTTSERRQYFDALEQGFKPRSKRSFRNLPNNWDDYVVSALFNRNWKRYRLTHYK